MDKSEYLRIGRAPDLRNPKDRMLFRMLEALPGVLSWGALVLAVLLSWRLPFWVAIYIILFSLFWLFRTIYFSSHLWLSYKRMDEQLKINWIAKLNEIPRNHYKIHTVTHWRDIYHLIVIPMYVESLEVVRDNFKRLIESDYPRDRMLIVLACEERVKEKITPTIQTIEQEFKKEFSRFLVTWHPGNIPGEIAGKGSNEAWASKKAKMLLVDEMHIPLENIIFSSFDVDTCVFKGYFSCLTHYYLTAKNPVRTSFQPVPLFINNIWQAPVISRLFSFSSTFWHTINQGRPEKLITFSSHSMSFKALVEVGFKQTNVVSDDSRIFWQCFLYYDGDYAVQPLYYPISMDANVAKSFWRTLVNVYKQQRRWAYGVGDIAYFLFGFIQNKKIPFKKKRSLSLEVIEGHFSWATASILLFCLGWLPILLGGPEFSQTMLSYSLPKITSRVLTVSMIGLVLSGYLSFLLLPPKPISYGRFRYLVFAFGWMFFPIAMIFFGSLPALEAQGRWLLGKYMGFWSTEKIRKPIRQVVKTIGGSSPS